MIPRIAVVGHPNKGKSSVVATLTENERVAIAPLPGTTQHAEHFTLEIDGRALYELIDTPGFQRAGQMFAWLEAHATDATTRRQVIEQFLYEHQDDQRYVDEREILTPILDGAGILYVVNGSKPWGPEYEIEMEILRWTGQPRMALINMIGEGDYREPWRQGLGQYFSLVREFNPVQADFDARLALLRAFGEIEESWFPAMQSAQEAIAAERERQSRRAALAIAGLVQDALNAHREVPLQEGEDPEPRKEKLTEQLLDDIRRLEQQARKSVQSIYHHNTLTFEEAEFALVNTDLFHEESWQIFGLSRTQLLATGAASGAVAGAGLDLIVGGTSLMGGTLVGGALGSVAAWWGGEHIAKVKVLGSPLGGNVLSVGPVQSLNFPWVLLGRACLHHALVSERNHAVRTALVARADDGDAAIDVASLPTKNRLALDMAFANIRKGKSVSITELTAAIHSLL
ncbi:MAG: GTPase/DUF3482 domain-containing protein [Pseudomonadota bacterium]